MNDTERAIALETGLICVLAVVIYCVFYCLLESPVATTNRCINIAITLDVTSLSIRIASHDSLTARIGPGLFSADWHDVVQES